MCSTVFDTRVAVESPDLSAWNTQGLWLGEMGDYKALPTFI